MAENPWKEQDVTSLSDEELEFYLPRLVDSYINIVKRRRRYWTLMLTFWLTGFVLAFFVSDDSNVKVPLSGIEFDRETAAQGFFAAGSLVAVASMFTFSISAAYRAEVNKLFQAIHSNEVRVNYFSPISTIDSIMLVKHKNKWCRILAWSFYVGQIAIIAPMIFRPFLVMHKYPISAQVLYSLANIGVVMFLIFGFFAREYGQSLNSMLTKP